MALPSWRKRAKSLLGLPLFRLASRHFARAFLCFTLQDHQQQPFEMLSFWLMVLAVHLVLWSHNSASVGVRKLIADKRRVVSYSGMSCLLGRHMSAHSHTSMVAARQPVSCPHSSVCPSEGRGLLQGCLLAAHKQQAVPEYLQGWSLP